MERSSFDWASPGLPAITSEWASIWPLWLYCSLYRSPQREGAREHFNCRGGICRASLKSSLLGECASVRELVWRCLCIRVGEGKEEGGGTRGALNEAINKIIFYPAKEITAWHSTTNPSTQPPRLLTAHFSLRKTHTAAPDGPLTERVRARERGVEE